MSDAGSGMESIAIIGLAGRFPGAGSVDELWEKVRDGVECIQRFSDAELEAAGVPSAQLKLAQYVKAGTTLAGVDQFDASFFGYNPREAEVIDPQQRVFLESAWEALESAGYDPERCRGAIGVFAGVGMNSYLFNVYSNREIMAAVGGYQAMISNDKDFLSTRVSYKLNLKGPSLTIQTACSTSLVAVQLAYQSLLNYQCDLALAGGICINLPQGRGYLYQEGMILSPDGHCRAFDAKAQGTVPGQGVGIVVLKRLSEALADGDTIHAIIRGAAINNDGGHKIGYTAPSVDGQAEVIATALAIEQISPETISYVEAHGTGTPLGDPIEVAALTRAFRAGTQKTGYCALGSLKTNLGHMDAAAGVGGLIKAVLALKHRQLPPSLHYEAPNSKIDFAGSPFFVNTQLAAWDSPPGIPRRACVSSFGIGGTNAHVVLEEAPSPAASPSARPVQLLLFSARSNEAVEEATRRLAAHLSRKPEANLADVAFTLQAGRRQFKHRRAVICSQPGEAVEAIMSSDPKRLIVSSEEARDRSVVFLFTGQGAQFVNMGADLYRSEPVFRKHLDECCDHLKAPLALDLRTVLFSTDPAASERLNQTDLAQPALFAVEYAMARLWISWGVRPQAMVGHSIGEYVAACLAEVFTLPEALALVAVRGSLMKRLPPGAMLSVSLPAAEVEASWTSLGLRDLSIASLNAPSLCVVSGPTPSVEALESELTKKAVGCRRLHTSHAFHSSMMDPILAEFTQRVAAVKPRAPKAPFVSNLTGAWIREGEATDPAYWAGHLRNAVRFSDGIQELLKEPRMFIEMGPGQTLTSLVRQHLGHQSPHAVIPSLPGPKDSQPGQAFLLNSLARYWVAGGQVGWKGFYAGDKRRRVPLPTYPFERQRYWVEPGRAQSGASLAERISRKKPDLADWFYLPSWRRSDLPRVAPGHPLVEPSAGPWLLFEDAEGLMRPLVARLREQGQEVVLVHVGSEFTRTSEGGFRVNPRERRGFVELLKDLRDKQRLPRKIVHGWCLTGGRSFEPREEALKAATEAGFLALLHLAQAVGDVLPDTPLDLYVVGDHLHEVLGGELVLPEKALLLGPARVINQEYSNIRAACIDVAVATNGAGGAWCDGLLREFRVSPTDAVVAHRGKHRWVQYLEPRRVEPQTPPAMVLREGGVYLITGGLGGIGLVLAEHLARRCRARLVLVSRSPIAPPSEWRSLVQDSKSADAATIERLKKLIAMEDLGAELCVLSADVADLNQMRGVVEQAEARFGAIHGVIHAAGTPGGGILQLRTAEAAERVLRAKCQGTLILESLLASRPPDFFLLCSSITSLLGGVGQADYCSANAFLDAYGQRPGGNGRWIAVNWFAWQEVGMAVNTEVPDALKKEREYGLRVGIAPSEGCEAFDRILSGTWSQLVVSPPDFVALAAVMARRREPEQATRPGSGAAPAAKPTHSRPALSSIYVAPGTTVERRLCEIWQQLLGIDRVGVHDNFFDLGGHSLMATQLIAQLRAEFPAELTVAILFERPTVSALAELLVGKAEDPAEAMSASSNRGQRRKERRLQRMAAEEGK